MGRDMQFDILCNCTLARSHKSEKIRFTGYNNYDLRTPIILSNPFGFENTNVEINKIEGVKYGIRILSCNNLGDEQAVDLLNKAVEYISFLMNKNEPNPNFGTLFIELELSSFGRPGMGTSMEAILSGDIDFNAADLNNMKYIDHYRYFYEGLKSNFWKSKYFHWFLILESIEQREDFRSRFEKDLLYNIEELDKIRQLANTMSDDRKKATILNNANRTKDNRYQKLTKYLKDTGITGFKAKEEEIQLTDDITKAIIDERNSLFHSGQSNESILWEFLFPLVTKIITVSQTNLVN